MWVWETGAAGSSTEQQVLLTAADMSLLLLLLLLKITSKELRFISTCLSFGAVKMAQQVKEQISQA